MFEDEILDMWRVIIGIYFKIIIKLNFGDIIILFVFFMRLLLGLVFFIILLFVM